MSTINPVFTKVYRDKLDSLTPTTSLNLGTGAGAVNQGAGAIAIGIDAGNTNQGTNAISMGGNSGNADQGIYAIAIGNNAGSITQGTKAIAIGYSSGDANQAQDGISIGNAAGGSLQKEAAIAIGREAGNLDQHINSISIGTRSGRNNQGQYAIAIGYEAGTGNDNDPTESQKDYAIAIGHAAGNVFQSTRGIAIGSTAGSDNQGTDAIAIGHGSGYSSQGNNAIAIGKYAGPTNQEANTIILNATGSAVETLGSNRTLIAPIRNVSSTGSFYPMNYNPTTKELAYSGTGSPIESSLVTFSAASAYDVDNIPSWVNHIQIVINNAAVANTTTPPMRILVGPIGTHWTSNYNGLIYSLISPIGNVAASTYIPLIPPGLTTQTEYNAILDLKKLGIVSTVQKWTWVLQGSTNSNGTKSIINGAGSISGTANQVIESVRIEANVNITDGYMKVFMY